MRALLRPISAVDERPRHASLFKGCSVNVGIAGLPGFAESLRLLIEDEGYSQLDVAMMFGVSRERIRQLNERLGIGMRNDRSVGLMSVRVWSDSLNRFRPIRVGDFHKARRRERNVKRRAAREQLIQGRQARIVSTLRSLHDRLGRTPTLSELAQQLWSTIEPNQVGAMLRDEWGDYRTSYRAATKAMYNAAGLEVRGVGGKGHTKRKDYFADGRCLKGRHVLAETGVYVYRKRRFCRACHIESSKRSYAKRKQRVSS